MSTHDVLQAAADRVAAFAHAQQEKGLWLASHELFSAMPEGLPPP